jgi:hypothetical protein
MRGAIKTTDGGVKAWGGTRMGSDECLHSTFYRLQSTLSRAGMQFDKLKSRKAGKGGRTRVRATFS